LCTAANEQNKVEKGWTLNKKKDTPMQDCKVAETREGENI